jgi:hypothetical protein
MLENERSRVHVHSIEEFKTPAPVTIAESCAVEITKKKKSVILSCIVMADYVSYFNMQYDMKSWSGQLGTIMACFHPMFTDLQRGSVSIAQRKGLDCGQVNHMAA